jgi:hypothetical protein
LPRKLEKIATVARLPSAIIFDAVNADFFKGIYCILDIEGGDHYATTGRTIATDWQTIAII